MFANTGSGVGGSQIQQKEEQDNNTNNNAGQPSQTIFNNVKTQNNIYINAGPAPGIANPNNKINLVKDNVD